MTLSDLVQGQLAILRREFFSGVPEKRFYQERQILIQAITWPARWMNERGAKLAGSDYGRILAVVIAAIKRHGHWPKARRFSLYFLKSVQEHMLHHGEDYYYRAKVRPVSAILPAVTRHVRAGNAGDTATETLAQMNRILRSPGGRRRAIVGADSPDLFAHCKRTANPRQKPRPLSV